MYDPIFYLHYQIQGLSAHARILASGAKNVFFVLHVYGLVVFQNRAHIQNFERWLSECLLLEMS